jgi:ATP phosphoribosyltransferase
VNEIARQVEEIIAAELGDFAARAALDKDCEHLGITPETLTPSHLPALADEVWRSVSFFSDTERGNQVKERIRHITA